MKNEKMGPLWAVMAYFLYSVAFLLIKTSHSSTLWIVFSRSLVGLLLFFPFQIGKTPFWKTEKLPLHLLRCSASFLGLFCSAYGVQYLPLVDAILLENTIPLFTPLVMWIFFRKKIKKIGVFALLLGFAGISFILKPSLAFVPLTSLASLSVGFFSAFSFVLIHQLSKSEESRTILFYFLAFSTLVSFIFLIFSQEALPDKSSLFILFALGVLFLMFQFLVIKAYSSTSPNKICCFSYLTVLFSAFWDWLLWGRTLDFLTSLGSACIVIAGILMLRKAQPVEEEVTS